MTVRESGNGSLRRAWRYPRAAWLVALATWGLCPWAYASESGADQTQGTSAEERSSSTLRRFGISWHFDRAYPAGRFANGDWWVVGPVTIVGIEPRPRGPGGRSMHGSMLNPSPLLGMGQGYDSSMYAQYATKSSYDPSLNVGLGLAPETPLILPPHSSLVSTISVRKAGQRPQLETAAILTVLAAAAPAGSFRPPYSGQNKSIGFNQRQLDYTKLGRLAPVASTPSLARVERMFERPWIDHVPGWVARYTHPLRNMAEYGREFTDQVGWGSLMLHLDFSNERKETLLVRFVQLGIDWYGVLRDGGQNNWDRNSTHSMGRKWPILFAGLMLDDPDMSGIGLDPELENLIGEDSMTFYVEETSPGVYNHGVGGYGPQHVGLAEWGSRHWVDPSHDVASWLDDPYRLCCTANVWWGQLLAAHIMGAQPLWNHDAVFDYQDRFFKKNQGLRRKLKPWQISYTPFPLEMWKAYRTNY